MPFTQDQLSSLFNTDSKEEKLSIDERVSSFQRSNPSLGESTNYQPGIGISYTSRQDPYELLGQYQDTWGEMFVPAMANLGGSFAASIGQTAGTLFAGIPTIASRFIEGADSNEAFAGLWDNPVNQQFAAWQKKLSEEFPIYRTKDEQNAGVLEYMFNKKFLASEAMSGIGYLLGAYVAGLGVTKAFGGLRGSTTLAKSLGIGADEELAMTTALTDLESVSKYDAITRTKDAFKQLGIAGTMAAGEASAEAIGVKDGIIQRLEQERSEGKNTLSDEQIKDQALAGANSDWLINLPIIATTDMLMFGKQLRGGMKSEKAAFGKIVEGTEDLAPGIKKMESKVINPWLDRAKRFGKGALEEGGQEYAQSISQIGLSNYYSERHNPNAKTQVEGLFSTLANTVAENSGDKETIISTILGGILGGPTHLISSRGERAKKNANTTKIV